MHEPDTLAAIVEMTRDEAGYHPSAASTSQVEEMVKRRVIRTQRMLYATQNWPSLNTLETISVNVGQRFYDVPARSNVLKSCEIYALWNSRPIEIVRGIGMDEYAVYDSELNASADPLRRWDLRRTATETQIELWPIPLTATIVRIWSMIPLQTFVVDEDLSTLDATLISMFAAATLMESEKADGAQNMRADAQELLRSMLAQEAAQKPPVSFAGGSMPRRGVQSVVVVR